MSAEARARAIVSVLMSIVRLRECGNNDGGDMTRAEKKKSLRTSEADDHSVGLV